MFAQRHDEAFSMGKSLLDKLEEVKDSIIGHTQAMKQMGLDRLLPDSKTINQTFAPAGMSWDNLGYPYALILASSTETLAVSYTGQTYTIPLQIGYNTVIIPNGATVTSGINFTAMVIFTTSEPPTTNESFVATPIKIASVPFTQFVLNTPWQQNFVGLLNRNASHRTILVINSMDVQPTACQWMPYESTINYKNAGYSYLSIPASAFSSSMYSDHMTSGTGAVYAMAPVDSVQIAIDFTSTLPTTGTFDIYMIESFQ